MAKKKLNKQQTRRISAHYQEKLSLGNEADAALVVAHLGYQLVVSDHDHLLMADWRKQIGHVAINDRVLISRDSDHHAIVEGIFPRGKTLYKWQGKKTKPIASNIDQLLIIISIEPDWQSQLLDRYLIAAREADISLAIVCNKIDLILNSTHQQRLAPYHELNYPVFYTSIKNNWGIESVREWLSGKETVICGQSGVGKSSLIRTLVPNADIWVQAISAATGLGRHTTSNARRYPLPNGGSVIDTPGVRGFALTHLDREHILAGFSEISPFASHCRFNDCSHTHEPDCGVMTALRLGKITKSRYDSMIKLLENSDQEENL